MGRRAPGRRGRAERAALPAGILAAAFIAIAAASAQPHRRAFPPPSAPPAAARPRLATDATRYLAFQVMLGTDSAEFPPPALVPGVAPPTALPLVRTPTDSIRALVDAIVATVGTTGTKARKLAFVVGPLAFDHADADAASIVHDAFAIARAEDVAVGFHLDDAMFWSASPLFSDANKEHTTGFDGMHLSTGLFIDWGRAVSFPARLCLNCRAVEAEVTRRARDVIGAAIAWEVAALRAEGREDLFAGVIVGWESHMGHDYALETAGAGADPRLGFHALANAGFGPSHPPASFGAEVANVVKAHVERWARGLADAGVPADRLYSHVAFLPKSVFLAAQAAGHIPPGVTYEDLVSTAPSSIDPDVAFSPYYRPGFSMYATPGTLDDVLAELAAHGNPPWAQSEGTNAAPGVGGGTTTPGGDTMERYLADRFDNGAALVNVFSMGIGGPGQAGNSYRQATEGPEAVAAYRRFLAP